MPSGLQQFSDLKFEGGGSKTIAMEYIIMVARVTGDATGDEQCLAIADGLQRLSGGPQRPSRRGVSEGGVMAGGESPTSPAPSGGPGSPTTGPTGLVGV